MLKPRAPLATSLALSRRHGDRRLLCSLHDRIPSHNVREDVGNLDSASFEYSHPDAPVHTGGLETISEAPLIVSYSPNIESLRRKHAHA